jgi:RimJ/RimL family protein N-acetyltransferase
MGDSLVIRYLNFDDDPSPQRAICFAQKFRETPNHYMYMIVLHTGEPIGTITFSGKPKHRRGTVGVMIGETYYWGERYGLEAVSILVESFLAHHYSKITTEIRRSNIAARRLFERLGFRQEGVLRQHINTLYGFDDIIIVSLFKDNFVKMD